MLIFILSSVKLTCCLLILCLKLLDFVEVMDQLPVFHNLKYLELQHSYNYWDKVLLAFLKSSPILETLAFPRGIVSLFPLKIFHIEPLVKTRVLQNSSNNYTFICSGREREINLIQYLLRHALVLEELIVFWHPDYAVADRMALESTLQNLPRASTTCSIQVQDQTL
ncbi:hypothetical protein RDABS01_028516 [Bienertia sinuspersici]